MAGRRWPSAWRSWPAGLWPASRARAGHGHSSSGSILGIIGLADVSDALPFDLGLAVVIPLAMIGIGVYLVLRDRLPMRR